MKVLALDTATAACSVGVLSDGAVLERFELGSRHSERILDMVCEALAEAGLALTQLDVLAFGRGPGLFTGLRIGAGVAQGLAFGADLPIVPISSLATLAQGQSAPRVLAAFDARMHQVYFGAYARAANGLVELAGNEAVVAPGMAPLPETPNWIGAGSGWDEYHLALLRRFGDRVSTWRQHAHPHAADLARLGAAAYAAGAAVPAERALPVYLRDEVAIKPRKV